MGNMVHMPSWLVSTISVIKDGHQLASGGACLCAPQKAMASKTQADCSSLGCCPSTTQIRTGWHEWVLSN